MGRGEQTGQPRVWMRRWLRRVSALQVARERLSSPVRAPGCAICCNCGQRLRGMFRGLWGVPWGWGCETLSDVVAGAAAPWYNPTAHPRQMPVYRKETLPSTQSAARRFDDIARSSRGTLMSWQANAVYLTHRSITLFSRHQSGQGTEILQSEMRATEA